jgi:hypothetical protein
VVISPILLLPRIVALQGRFTHTFYTRLLPDGQTPEEQALARFTVCETPLPANFCTCGLYMLFEDDAVPDEASPTSDPESPSCPPGPAS